MPLSLSLPRRCLAGVLAAALALGPSVGALAQVPGSTVADVLEQLNASQRTAVREGQATQAEGGPVTQAAVGQTQAPTAKPEPFGASLFAAGGTPVSDAVNPDY